MQFFLLLLFCSGSNFLFSQTYNPGVSTFDATGFVEYIPGNLPVIISVPHGGDLEPDTIPDRDCDNCVYLKDAYTQELARSISDAFFEQTGCYAHLVINLLHRKKFDANRDIGDAADGNPKVEQAWYGYHDFLDAAKAQAVEDYERGLFIDLHGHAHEIQRLELGYLLSKSELQLTDAELNSNTYVDESSIKSLVGNNLHFLTHAELLRGTNSLGTMLENKGVPAVPSTPDPFPLDNESYFSGGYNTDRHGSIESGTIDGIQIECHQDIRFDADLREMFADTLTNAINEYIDYHYNGEYLGNYCNLITVISKPTIYESIEVFPNPASNLLNIKSELNEIEIFIYNYLGQRVSTYIWTGTPIDVSSLKSGYYFLEFRKGNLLFETKRLLKH